jgi:glutamine amidotransferase-like uncharacterized protein
MPHQVPIMTTGVLATLLTLLINHPDVTVTDSGKPGPTVMVVITAHQNSAAVSTLSQLRNWPLQNGRLICAAGPAPAERLAGNTVDWLVELHETANAPNSSTNPGHAAITPGNSSLAAELAPQLITAVNSEIEAPSRRFQISNSVPADSLIAAPEDHSWIPEVTQSLLIQTPREGQPLAVRARQQRLIIAALLHHLKLIESTSIASQLVPAELQKQFNIALLDDAGVAGRGVPSLMEIWSAEPEATVHRICSADIRSGCLTQFDLLCCSGGSGSRQATTLGENGRAEIRRFVTQGGDYVGICAGSYLACSGFSWGLGILDARTKSSKWKRGRANLPLQLTPAGTLVFTTGPETATITYNNGPIIQPHQQPDIPDFEVLANFTAEVAQNETPTGIMINSPAIVIGKFGEGDVLCISPHPEQSGDVGRQWVIAALRHLQYANAGNKAQTP